MTTKTKTAPTFTLLPYPVVERSLISAGDRERLGGMRVVDTPFGKLRLAVQSDGSVYLDMVDVEALYATPRVSNGNFSFNVKGQPLDVSYSRHPGQMGRYSSFKCYRLDKGYMTVNATPAVYAQVMELCGEIAETLFNSEEYLEMIKAARVGRAMYHLDQAQKERLAAQQKENLARQRLDDARQGKDVTFD